MESYKMGRVAAAMRKEYDFGKSVRNPYAKHLKKQVTMRLNTDVIAYFEALAEESGIPYQNLINLYLSECAHSGKKLSFCARSAPLA